MHKTIKTISVGGGYFAQFHLEAWQRLPNINLAAIVDTNANTHDTLKKEFPEALVFDSLEKAARQVDADIVDLVTPPATHHSLIKTALKCCPKALIVCQKPFCDSLSVATATTALATQQGREIVVHENFRFQPWYTKIKSLLNNKAVGQALQVTFRLRPGDGQGVNAYLDRQPYFQQMKRFLIHETGVHWIDVFRYLLGEPNAVSADLRRINPAIAGEDAGHFIFHYDNGLRAHFDGNRLLDHAADNTRHTMGEMMIEGTEGTITLNGDGEISLRCFSNKAPQSIPYDFELIGFGADCVRLLQAHVVDHLLHQTPLQNKASDYLQNLRIEEAIYTAAQSNSLISLGQE